MADICRVDTDALESAAVDLEQEKPKLDAVRTEATGAALPAEAFGRVDQSAPAAQGYADSVRQIGQELEAANAEIAKLAEYLRAWKNKYETDTNRAVQCLINLRKLRNPR